MSKIANHRRYDFDELTEIFWRIFSCLAAWHVLDVRKTGCINKINEMWHMERRDVCLQWVPVYTHSPVEIKTAFNSRSSMYRLKLAAHRAEASNESIVSSYRREKVQKIRGVHVHVNTWCSEGKWWMGDAYLLTNPVSDRIGIIHWWYRWSQGGFRRRPTCRTAARSRTHSWFPTRFSILLCPPSSSRGKTNNHHVTQHTQTQVHTRHGENSRTVLCRKIAEKCDVWHALVRHGCNSARTRDNVDVYVCAYE